MAAALFTALDPGVFGPTELTRGPWSDDAQHGGPVSALLAGAVEGHPTERRRRVVRLTIELLRPIPLRPLRVEVAGAGGGGSVDRVAARVFDASDGTLLASALGLRTREKPVAVPPDDDPPPAGPEAARPMPSPGFLAGRTTFVVDGMELRFATGAFETPGPARTWFRLRVPVVEGRPTTPLQRVAAAADFGNGISGTGEMSRLLYVNPDLTIALHRHPEGEWILLDAVSHLEPDGIGGAESALSDQRGRIGNAYQTLLVSQR